MTWLRHRLGNSDSGAALGGVLLRYVRELHPVARAELRGWRDRALRIPDRELRRQALATLSQERANAEGAAIFAALAPAAWGPLLVRAHVAYQVMYDYLDTVTEPAVPDHAADCERLHRAVTDALVPGASAIDWYALHPSRDDGGYLGTQVSVCQSVLARMPSLPWVAAHLDDLSRRSCAVQTLNHCWPNRRTEALSAWASELWELDPHLTWWEHAAGASSTLAVHALIALAAISATQKGHAAIARPHLTALCAVGTLLESLVDLPLDRRTGDHSYVSYYRDPTHMAERIGFIADRTARLTEGLPQGRRHLAITQAMASLYLARPEAWTNEARPAARATLDALRFPMRPLIVLHRLRTRIPALS